MKELSAIYKKDTGMIVSHGIINRTWDLDHLDGSTKSEQIQKTLDDNPDLGVVYLPNRTVIDMKSQKIENDKLVDFSDDDNIEKGKSEEIKTIKSDLFSSTVFLFEITESLVKSLISNNVLLMSDIGTVVLRQRYSDISTKIDRLKELES